MSDKPQAKTPVPPDYWPCACVKRDKAGNLTHFGMQPPTVKRCRRCGAKQPAPA